ncbi:aspartyl-phosphate phosphatase Spo0E family protein [Desulfosporosinus fructosivorans]
MKQLTTDEKIEELRLLMQAVASDKDLTDQRVVSMSTKLDLLINEFYRNNIRFRHSVM